MILNNNLGGFSFGYTDDGKPGYKEAGADSVVPFKKADNSFMTRLYVNSTLTAGGQAIFARGDNDKITFSSWQNTTTVYGGDSPDSCNILVETIPKNTDRTIDVSAYKYYKIVTGVLHTSSIRVYAENLLPYIKIVVTEYNALIFVGDVAHITVDSANTFYALKHYEGRNLYTLSGYTSYDTYLSIPATNSINTIQLD